MLSLFTARSCTQWRSSLLGASLAFLLFAPLASVRAQSEPVLHWINDLGQDGVASLNSTSNFITDFKGTNDVQIKMIFGSVNSIFSEAFTIGATNSNNNPSFLTNFFGLAGNGTGDSARRHLKCLETALSGEVILQFDFSIPLTTDDRLFITDVESGEAYKVQAYFAGQELKLTGWSFTNYSGEMSQLPDATWPTWDAGANTLSASTQGGLTEPLSVFTPDQSVDRVIITRLDQGGGSAAIQFMNVPSSQGSPTLQIAPLGNRAILSWPASFPNYSLQTSSNISPAFAWATIGNAPVLSSNRLVVTNLPGVSARFYRLKHL